METSANVVNGVDYEASREEATQALTKRLTDFRAWCQEEAGITVHPSVCIVNGDATDGTKYAPVLTLGAPSPETEPRLGSIEGVGHESLYAKTMGCQVRAVREMKKGDTVFTMPRGAMITPDTIASSDAGKAVLACCESLEGNSGFWDSFGNTRELEQAFGPKINRNGGAQLLVKILQERKRAETALANRTSPSSSNNNTAPAIELCETATLSTRAPLLAFLIHQRFHSQRAPVAQFEDSLLANDHSNKAHNALHTAAAVQTPPNSPVTFGPYAETLPTAILIPLCWSRNELALLSGSIPGIGILQEVAAHTMQLAAEFVALLDAGILERFPDVFPPGLLTWERWVWAAAIVHSRQLPASCYFNKSDAASSSFRPEDPLEFQSPPAVWDELGVMVPLMDMMNHEIEYHQLVWQQSTENTDDPGEEGMHPPRASLEKRVKKGNEIFCAYGNLANHRLLTQYGMAQVNNSKDEVRISWSLSESVGGAKAPEDFDPPVPDTDGKTCDDVYESSDSALIDEWWTEDRIKLLQTQAFQAEGESIIASLKQGKKLSASAYNDGAYNPILLAAVVVATMPPSQVKKNMSTDTIIINSRHKRSLRNSLAMIFCRKLEKLLGNLSSGLEAHYKTLKLWTKASKGGLRYRASKEGDESMDEDAIGWSTFFEANAFVSIMEVEKNAYYAMAPDSCVLVFFDGQLRSLQLSLDTVIDDEMFEKDVMKQLQDIGFEFSEDTCPEDDGAKNGDDKKSGSQKDGGDGKKASPGRKRRNRKKKDSTTTVGSATGAAVNGGDKPPALKLHIGNLAYSTTPSDLYDFFSTLYGKDNILECHIPVERETKRSRGFGFVTMPESVAQKALTSGKKHEIAGRLLKVARSNSAGTSDANRNQSMGSSGPSKDRCATCGYRPRYCVCSVPNIPTGQGPPGPPGPPPPYRNGHGMDAPPPPLPPPEWRMREEEMRRREEMERYGRGEDRYRHDRYMEERYGRPRGYERGYSGDHDYDRDRRDHDRDRDRDRYYDDDWDRRRSDYRRGSRRRSRSASRSPSPRGRHRSVDSRSSSRRRGEADDRDRRSRDRRGDMDNYEHRKRSRSPRSRSRTRSRSRSPERSRKKKSKK